MNKKIITGLAGIVCGCGYFILSSGRIWMLAVLIVAALATRLSTKYKALGKYLFMLGAFLLTNTLIEELGIHYPESLILILTAMMVLVFYEGPEWGNLYFGPGKLKDYLRLAQIMAVLFACLFGILVYLQYNHADNPVPLMWPIDTLIIIGVGFACYVAIMEEIIFRSFLLQRATEIGGDWAGIVSQGVFYGAMSFVLPVTNGLPGFLLGSVYGIALGYLVKKSDSIYLSIFVHFLVSLIIFIELSILGRLEGL